MRRWSRGGWAGTAAVTAILAVGFAAPEALGAESGKPITIGYSTYTVANPAFAGIIQGMKSEAEKFGYKFLIANSNNSATQQIADIDSLITQGTNYIIITPVDGAAVTPANANGIPVIAHVDHVVAPVTATYSMDHSDGGKLAGEEIVKYLTAKYGTPKGNIVDLEGIAGIVAAAQREKGFADVIAKYPDIKVVARADGGFNTDQANAVMTNILPAQPNIDAVYGANDAETYGAITAIKAADRFQPAGKPGHIYAIGIDGSAPGINGIRDGSQDASVSQQFIKMSTLLIDNIHAKEAGQAKDIPSVVWPLKVITADNIKSDDVKQYGIWADDVKQ
jgi:ribose transport system substrate-binding protein